MDQIFNNKLPIFLLCLKIASDTNSYKFEGGRGKLAIFEKYLDIDTTKVFAQEPRLSRQDLDKTVIPKIKTKARPLYSRSRQDKISLQNSRNLVKTQES